jgi:hypothetical protein
MADKEVNPKKEKSLSNAVEDPGAFTAWCKQQGFDGVCEECIAKGKASDDTHMVRMATLAQTFRKVMADHNK